MPSESLILKLLTEQLSGLLGAEYRVHRNMLTHSITRKDPNPHYDPDLVIWPNTDGEPSPVIVEFKESPSLTDLPLSTARHLKLIREANNANHPQMVLATTSHVSDLLREELDSENIDIVQSTHVTDLARQIVEIVKRGSKNPSSL